MVRAKAPIADCCRLPSSWKICKATAPQSYLMQQTGCLSSPWSLPVEEHCSSPSLQGRQFKVSNNSQTNYRAFKVNLFINLTMSAQMKYLQPSSTFFNKTNQYPLILTQTISFDNTIYATFKVETSLKKFRNRKWVQEKVSNPR